MGKDSRGKELGTGISQRKDGLYTGRFTDKTGKRRQKYFKKLQECRKWIADMQFLNEHGDISAGADMTVDAWFRYFIEELKGTTIRDSTKKSYKERYNANMKQYIGSMLISDVKPMHCQNILNQMAKEYTTSTIRVTRIVMHSMFEVAVDNDIIVANPVRKSVKVPDGKKSKEIRFLTKEEQKLFLEATQGFKYHNQYSFILQTGLRAGEMIGLKWSDIDFEKGIININRTMGYDYVNKRWNVGPPKSSCGRRKIPMTQECREILRRQKKKIKSQKVVNKDFSDFVFVNKKGVPLTDQAYNGDIIDLEDKIGLEHFSVHSLRHTYATRCIEAGMRPKTLQMLLGHSNISITMNLYVHVSEDEKIKEVMKVEEVLNAE